MNKYKKILINIEMKNICQDIMILILRYSESSEILKIILLEKKNNNNHFLNIYFKTLKREIILNYFDEKIIDLFGNIERFEQVPILTWKKEYIGFTDYIDSIPIENMTHNIMIGIDDYERPFIAIKNKDKVSIIFQRYMFIKKIWASSNFDTFYGHFYKDNVFIKNINELRNLILL